MGREMSKKPHELSPKQARFVEEYLIDLNATQAALRAGYELGLNPTAGFYVYFLIDPRNGKIFYVGKGKGKRMFAHARAAYSGVVDNEPKFSRIRDIRDAGLFVIEAVFAQCQGEGEAYDLERQAIEALRYTGLTNISHGIVTNEQATIASAQFTLLRMLPLNLWLERQIPQQHDLARRVFGSPEAAYQLVRAGLSELAGLHPC